MRVVVAVLFIVFFTQNSNAQVDLTNWRDQSCSVRWQSILDQHKSEADEHFAEAERYWREAQSIRRQRGDKLPGEEGATMNVAQWKRSVRNEGFALSTVVDRLDKTRKVYDYYDRREPTSGWESYIKWKHPRKTWYSYHIEHVKRDRNCISSSTTYKGQRMSIYMAARRFDDDIKRETARWKARVKELRERYLHLEEYEIKRLKPEKFKYCMFVTKKHASYSLARDFCGKIDSVGYNKLMPFVGCISNLRYWGYANPKTEEYAPYESEKVWSTRSFNTCKRMENIEAMLGGESWSNCMGRVVHHYSFSSDAARFCVREHNTAVANATRLNVPLSLELDTTNPYETPVVHE